jgi:hypothetical protein
MRVIVYMSAANDLSSSRDIVNSEGWFVDIVLARRKNIYELISRIHFFLLAHHIDHRVFMKLGYLIIAVIYVIMAVKSGEIEFPYLAIGVVYFLMCDIVNVGIKLD